MRISHKYRFIFLANPRTGSKTIRRLLDNYSDIKSVTIDQTNEDFPFYHHIPAKELKDIFDIKGWDWFSYKRFCVVRNPYSRLVSLYHHYKKQYCKRKQSVAIEKSSFLGKKTRMLKIKKRRMEPAKSFREYVLSVSGNRLTTTLKNFICNEKGNFLVDDILMFENLSSELPKYLQGLGIYVDSSKIPVVGASNIKKYKEFYDEDTKFFVKTFYSYEIKRFDYHFESLK